MKTDSLIIFLMVPVTKTSGRVLRSERTGLRCSQRTKATPPTRRASRRNAKRLYQNCNEALVRLEKGGSHKSRDKDHQETALLIRSHQVHPNVQFVRQHAKH